MLNFGDWVQIQYGEYEGQYARIANRRKSGEYGVLLYKDVMETKEPEAEKEQPGILLYFDEEMLVLVEPFLLSRKDLKSLVRAETAYSDFAEKVFPPFNLRVTRKYTMKVEDLREALNNINRQNHPLSMFKQWFWLILNVFYDSLNIRKNYEENVFSDFPKDEKEIFSTVYGMTEKLYWRLEERFGTKEENEQYMIRFQDEPFWETENPEQDDPERAAYFAVCADIISRIDSYLLNLGKPQGSWSYSISQMKHVVGEYETEKDLESATPEALALYREFVRRLYRAGDVQAVKILAWGYMEGGIAYRRNYDLAQIYMQELYEKTGDAYAANCLGYLYYHGLTNHGVPQYDKAFPFFSYGVLDGVEESVYMAADMLIHGQGTVRNIDMGLNLLVDGYRNAQFEFCHGSFDCRFAEYAQHLGDCCLEGIIFGMGMKDAYRFFLEAEYAAKKREATEHPAGQDLKDKINRSLEYIRERVGIDPSRTELKADFPVFISQMYEDHYPVKVSLTRKQGTSDIVLKVAKFDLMELFQTLKMSLNPEDPEHSQNEFPGAAGKLLVTYPELSWSGLVSEMEYRLENATILKQPEKPGPFLSDGFRRENTTNVLEFYAHGEVIAALEADWYVVSVKKKRKQKT